MLVRVVYELVKDVTSQNFGLLIAYLIPGLTVLWGISHVSETVTYWLNAAPGSAATVGGFLYGTIASIGIGLTLSTLRWAIIDPIHHKTGIPVPPDDFSNLDATLPAFQYIVGSHYDYYKFYSNQSLALIAGRVAGWIEQHETSYLLARSEATRLCLAAFDAAGIVLPEPIFRIAGADGLALPAQQEGPPGRPAKEPQASHPAPEADLQAVTADAEAELEQIVEQERAELKDHDLLNKSAPEE